MYEKIGTTDYLGVHFYLYLPLFGKVSWTKPHMWNIWGFIYGLLT